MDQNAEAASGFFTGHRSSRLICCGLSPIVNPTFCSHTERLWPGETGTVEKLNPCKPIIRIHGRVLKRAATWHLLSLLFVCVCVWKWRVYNGYIAVWCIFNSEHKDKPSPSNYWGKIFSDKPFHLAMFWDGSNMVTPKNVNTSTRDYCNCLFRWQVLRGVLSWILIHLHFFHRWWFAHPLARCRFFPDISCVSHVLV